MKNQLQEDIDLPSSKSATLPDLNSSLNNESIYQKIFNFAPIGIAYVGTDFTFLKVNPMLCQLLGYSEDELVGKSFVDITHPDDVDKDVHLADKLFHGQISSYQLEKRYLTKDQQIIWINLTGTLFRNPDGTVNAIGLIENITKRKQAEEALRASEQRYRMLVEQAGEGIVICNRDGKILMVNSKACELVGHPQEEIINQDVQSFISPEDLRRQPLRFEQLQKGELIRDERIIFKKDGERITIDVSSKHISDNTYQVIFRDVSQRKAHEEKRDGLIGYLEKALESVQTLESLLPICSTCKKIRDDKGYWQQIDAYITEHTGTLFSHTICENCTKNYYPEFYDKMYSK
jgi:PAS domain S-box-containing protein